MADWKSIETAPDGDWVLLGNPDDEIAIGYRVKWRCGWVWDLGDDHREDGHFTHWMPLPEAPSRT